MSLYKQMLAEIKENPKLQLLKEASGKQALDGMKFVFFGSDTESGEKWAKQFSAKEIRSAKLLVISRLKRTQKEIQVKLILGSSDTEQKVLGEKMTYPQGIKFVHDFF